MEGNDMITNLYRLPKLEDRKDTIQIKRAFAGDKGAILNFIKSNFSEDSWVYESEGIFRHYAGGTKVFYCGRR